MLDQNLSVIEIQKWDIDLITSYWLDADPEFLLNMGVDLDKVPGREEWRAMLMEQIDQPYSAKKSYCLIWQVDKIPVGHSNVNKIVFGKEAYMHLHLWNEEVRKMGYGSRFVKMGLPYFFEHLKLQTLYCEPYALNQAPNNLLEKIGFEFIKSYTCIPGWLNFEQEVNLWEMTREKFVELYAV